MEQDYVFPIAVKREGSEIVVRFIDFDIQEQRYEEEDDYITESKIMLSNILLEYEQKKITIPPATKLGAVKIDKDEQIVFLNLWLPFYRTENEKYVKKTLTIPEWIDMLAKQQNLNFSQILRDALLDELGLQDEVKKRKLYRFNKPMRKIEDFLIIAQEMIKANSEEEKKAFLLACKTEDFNLIVMLWVVWINKNILLFFKNDKNDKNDGDEKIRFIWNKQEWEEHTENFRIEFKKNVTEKCNKIVRQLKVYNIEQSAVDALGKYISKFAEWILNAALKYNGIFERNESIYDYMRAITSKGMLRKNIKKDYWEEYYEYYLFTLQYKIEVPYMFVLVWNINNIYSNERFNYFNKERDKNSLNICHECLKRVSNTSLEILLGNSIFSECLERKVIASKTKDGKKIPVITREGSINLSGYLPYLWCIEESINEYTDIFNKIVSQNVLKSIPMVPMNINKGDKIGLKYLIHLLCAEVEKSNMSY